MHDGASIPYAIPALNVPEATGQLKANLRAMIFTGFCFLLFAFLLHLVQRRR